MTKARSCRRIRNFKVRQVRCISLAAEVSYLGTIIERGWEPYASVLLELGNMSACIIWCTINFSWQIGVSHLHLTTLLNYALAKVTSSLNRNKRPILGKSFTFMPSHIIYLRQKNNLIALYFTDLVDVVKRESKANLETSIKAYKCKWELAIMGCFDILVRGWKLARWVW